MIDKDEIIAVADETGLTPAVVEKDYVLGWLLAAIDANDRLASWVFKGGTCLKKCYFETYRFSEDLDFTLQDESHIDESFLKGVFAQISEWLYEASGIEIPVERLIFDIYTNPRGRQSCEGRVYYQSHFASGKKNIPKIKFDLTADEILVLLASQQPVFHAYSDLPPEGFQANCYSYPEIFGEKVRALVERGRPRDLYDVINLYRNDNLPSPPVLKDVLAQKCAYKNIGVPTIDAMEAYKDDLSRNWKPMLDHQLPALPALDTYWDVLPEFFEWLESDATPEKESLGRVSNSGVLYRPAYGHLGLRASSGNSLEIIRFAAGNRLCVDLDYTDNEGRRSTRAIEPYSLRRAGTGNILLYAVRAEDGQTRAYNIDNINDASITNRPFVPRYQIELSPEGALPPVSQTSGSASSLGPPIRSGIPRRKSRSRLKTYSDGPKHFYRCPICDKQFRRKTQNPKLNAHKSKDGYPCPGRTGYYEKTTY